jgi:hypothetical protein
MSALCIFRSETGKDPVVLLRGLPVDVVIVCDSRLPPRKLSEVTLWCEELDRHR